MPKTQLFIDHLFRHQYGKMVSILTRIFGLNNLEIVEDAVQDTFAKAVIAWHKKIPENPEAWLTQAAKNRIIDLFRKVKSDDERAARFEQGTSAIAINELFLEHEIEDAELRMIFTACHPSLSPQDQMAFALRTISGFSGKEIAAALLLKPETIKKRLTRARQSIAVKNIQFAVPSGKELPQRIDNVLHTIYLIFNEGFHSNREDTLVRKDLCGEALRLCKMVLKRESLRSGKVYGLFALMCFHSSRLESKTDSEGAIIDLENQDRSLWHTPLIDLGKTALIRAFEGEVSAYQIEAAIAFEHCTASHFSTTNWERILLHYQQLSQLQNSDLVLLNQAIVLMQLKRNTEALHILQEIDVKKLEQRAYLYHGAMTEYYLKTNNRSAAKEQMEKTLSLILNEVEKSHFKQKYKHLTEKA